MSAGIDVLFAGGGSGGHLFPGLAVAAALQKLQPELRLHFVGSDRAIERQIMHNQPWPHTPLPVVSPARLLRNPLSFVISNWRAWSVTKSFWKPVPPRVVVGLGGFASVPALMMATRRRTPIVLLEQNAIPGRATRWFAKRAAAVCLGFPEAVTEFTCSVNSIATGNPVREDIAALTDHHSAPEETRLLILGGSQGATGLNQAMIAWLKARPKDLQNWTVVHQAGPHAVAELRAAYQAAGITARVEEFLSDMASEYRAATVVIARAGATTLAELACAGRPAILVPFPQAADDHQRRNAQWFVQAGAALCVEQRSSLQETATDLAAAFADIAVPERSTKMAQAIKQRAYPNAAERVADVIRDALASVKT
ncbi:MAG TPA: undecaprenyldiphospho-muramoylpentapeptide beta-N-acetylglucosaminyltransferase [Planctomycetaceae bacterium]|nr:undecaprenyldiphospho-muramoylpentapeptide beta-N-acetylglucosaminyltransferase [Planctomycetaceae bacterium]